MLNCLPACRVQMRSQPMLLTIATVVENSLESLASSSIIDNAPSLLRYQDGKRNSDAKRLKG